MDYLSRDPSAFIRPSPAGTTLGGVARRTREAMVLCEAAGYDVVIVETVGVGQSETAVADMVDVFLLLLLPGGGDELQGIKKGIVELADIIAVNKADGDLAGVARHSAADYRSALHLLRPTDRAWAPPVLTCSAMTGQGIDAVWDMIMKFRAAHGAEPDLVGGRLGRLDEKRAQQASAWMWAEIGEGLTDALRATESVARRLPTLEAAVRARRISPGKAAQQVLAAFLANRETSDSSGTR